MKQTYTVYTHRVVNDDNGPMYYVGVTTNLPQRWKPYYYKGSALFPFVEKYGWENIEHSVFAKGLDYVTAYRLEDFLIRLHRSFGCCINKNGSGLKSFSEYEIKRREIRRELKYESQEKEREIKLEQRKQAKELKHQRSEENRREYNRKRRKRPGEKEKERKRNKQYYSENTEYFKEYDRKRRSTPEGKIYGRVKDFNRAHPDKAVETPLEARNKYLDSGYIPNYIKNIDL